MTRDIVRSRSGFTDRIILGFLLADCFDKLLEPVGAAFPNGALLGQPSFDGSKRFLFDGADPHATHLASESIRSLQGNGCAA